MNSITYKKGTNTLEKIQLQISVYNTVKGIYENDNPNILEEFSSLSAYLINDSKTIVQKWNWQKDGELLTGHEQILLDSVINEFILPFKQANFINIATGKYKLKVKYKYPTGIKEEFEDYINAVEILSSEAELIDTE